jgi:hypothetical protein
MELERKAGSLKAELSLGETGEEWARKLEGLWKAYLDKTVRRTDAVLTPLRQRLTLPHST